jgi:hypothetical protein
VKEEWMKKFSAVYSPRQIAGLEKTANGMIPN